MAIPGDDANRILKEVTLGMDPPATEPEEYQLFRERVQAQVDVIAEMGGSVELPPTEVV